ncbi:MAG TPA: hypothetical protein P5081_04915 [Phycisphaerae bacterium]|nr:hypothetical protein [Phycisphaerae bacterium]HRW52205.1 hypothetical protein [Phycisphaerae bacterium]
MLELRRPRTNDIEITWDQYDLQSLRASGKELLRMILVQAITDRMTSVRFVADEESSSLTMFYAEDSGDCEMRHEMSAPPIETLPGILSLLLDHTVFSGYFPLEGVMPVRFSGQTIDVGVRISDFKTIELSWPTVSLP